MLVKFARKFAVAGLAVATLGVAGCGDTAEPQLDNIVNTAVNAGSFTTLVTAVQAASLDPTLANDGPFTVFAPTDAAFAALPAGTIDALLLDIPTLTDVLLYHVVAGQVLAADVVSLSSATTLQGATVAIDASSGVKVNDANVIQTDVLATNGVIHVIDKVLLPPQ